LSEQAILRELRSINESLKPDLSYIERFTLSKAAVQSIFDDTLLVDGQEYNLYVISTDGNIDDISYQVTNQGGGKVDEMEAAQFPYIPGPVKQIRFKNDTAEAGTSIQVTAYKISRLAPAMPPPSPPGTRGDIVDPHIFASGTGRKIEIPYTVTLRKNASKPIVFTSSGITTTNQFDTFNSPDGTDYSVPVGKILIVFSGHCKTSAAAKALGFGYADDAINNSATDGTNPVIIHSGATWENATADQTFELINCYGEIPAGKFPRVEAESTSGTMVWGFMGIEVDA